MFAAWTMRHSPPPLPLPGHLTPLAMGWGARAELVRPGFAGLCWCQHRRLLTVAGPSRRRDCHSADTPPSSLLKHLPQGEEGAAE